MAPVPRKFLQLESDYIVIRVQHCVHVSMEPLESVNSLHVEFNFNLVVWICSNHEVNVIPVRKQKLLKLFNDVFKLAFANHAEGLLRPRWPEFSVKKLSLLNPFSPESLILGGFVRVRDAEEPINKSFVRVVLERVLVFEKSLILPRVERQRMDISLFNFLFDEILSVLFMLSPVLIWHPFKFLEEPTVLPELLEMRFFVLTDNARKSQLLFHFYLKLLQHVVRGNIIWQIPD